MNGVWSLLASVVEALANLGAGMASTGIGYEPELPERAAQVTFFTKRKGPPLICDSQLGDGPFSFMTFNGSDFYFCSC